jgi:hypothetical protein
MDVSVKTQLRRALFDEIANLRRPLHDTSPNIPPELAGICGDELAVKMRFFRTTSEESDDR